MSVREMHELADLLVKISIPCIIVVIYLICKVFKRNDK